MHFSRSSEARSYVSRLAQVRVIRLPPTSPSANTATSSHRQSSEDVHVDGGDVRDADLYGVDLIAVHDLVDVAVRGGRGQVLRRRDGRHVGRDRHAAAAPIGRRVALERPSPTKLSKVPAPSVATNSKLGAYLA